MITRSESQFKGRISSILQVFVEAAVAEICEYIDLEVATLRAELSVCRPEKGSARGKLQSQSTEQNISSGNGREFGTPDNNDTLPHCIAGREQAERKLFRNQGSPKTSHPCALWNQQSGSEDGQNATDEECTELDAVSVKKEMLEDSEQSNKARDKQEADTSTVAMGLPDPNESMGTAPPSPHARLEWATSEPPTRVSAKCGSKSEPLCERSGSRPSCMDCGDESEEEDLQEWDSAVAAKHYAASAQLAQGVDLQQEQEQEQEEGKHGAAYLTHWTDPASPHRAPPHAHHSMQYLHEEPPDPMGGFGLNLPPGSSDYHNVRGGDLSVSHLGMAMQHGADLEERYICPMCGKILRTDRALRAHVKDHTTLHICNHCGKSFARLTNLRVHQNIHMGLKPYTCKFCSKKFSDPSNYNRHKQRCPPSAHA